MPPHGPPQGPCDVGIALARMPPGLPVTTTNRPTSPARLPAGWSHGRALVALSRPPERNLNMHPRNSPGERRPTFEFSTDPRTGRAVVSVSILHSEDRAILDAPAFASLVSAHGLSSFYRNKAVRHAGHVLFKSKRDKRVYVVARAIMGDRKGAMVEVADGDLTNLRRSNLYYRKGGTGGIRRSDGKARAEPAGGDLGAEAAFIA